MVKNGPLQAGMIRQSRGAEASGNGKAVSKLNTYKTPSGAVTGRQASGMPVAPPKATTPGISKPLPSPTIKTLPGKSRVGC